MFLLYNPSFNKSQQQDGDGQLPEERFLLPKDSTYS